MVLWFEAFHVISVVAWMAGLFYLPRLFVYHELARAGSESSEIFKVMERRLLWGIMLPAGIASWGFGILTGWWGGLFSVMPGWLVWKLVMVVGMTGVHFVCVRFVWDFAADKRGRGDRFYRILNEIPTVLLVGIVILVVVQPG